MPFIKPLERFVAPVLEKKVWRPLVREAKEIPVLRRIVKFFGQPDEEYRIARQKAIGEVAKIGEVARHFSSKIEKLPKEHHPKLFEYLTSPELKPPEFALWAKDIKDWIAKQGRELVEREILKPEQFEKWRYQYLPRLLIKQIDDLERVDMQVMKTGVKLSLRYTKPRRPDVPEEIFIQDPAVLVPYTIFEEGRDLAIYDLLRTVATNPDWVWQPSVVRYKGRLYSAYDLFDKLERGLFPKEEHETIKKLLKPILEKERQWIRGKIKVKEVLAPEPKGYIKIPDHQSYGNLRGLYVKEEIAQDILPHFKITDKLHASEFLRNLERSYFAFHSIWKGLKVTVNPPTMMRNFGSNIIQLNMSGMSFAEIPYYMNRALDELTTKGKLWREAFNRGLTQVGFAPAELGELKRAVSILNKAEGRFWKFLSTITETMRTVSIPYQKIDEFYRLTKFIERVEKGLSYDKAMVEANKWVMDYTLVPPLIRFLRTNVLGAPFISYYYKLVPLLAETIVVRPWVLIKYAALPYMVTKAAIEFNPDFTEEDAEEAFKLLPDYYRKGNVFVVPWKTEEGELVIIPYGYFIPWGGMVEATYDLLKGNFRGALEELPTPYLSSPLYNIVTGFIENRDTFTNKVIAPEYLSIKERLVRTLYWVANQLLPPFATQPYGAIPEAIRTFEGLKGHPLAKMFGVNIKDTDIRKLKSQARKRLRHFLNEAGTDIYKERQKFKEGKITREELQENTQKIRVRMRQLRKEFQEFLREEKPLWREIYGLP